MTTSTVRVARGPLHAARIGWERGKLEIREFLRQRESVVFTLLFPIILLLFFTQIIKYNIPGGISFAQYFVPGILAVGLFGASFQTLAIQISIEREKGILKRLEGTPMPPSSYFIGKIIMVFTIVILETAVLLGVSAALGKVSLPSDAGKWLTWLWVTVLGVAAGSVLGMAFSSLARSGKAAPAVVTPVALVLQFISGVYFVFSQSPTWLQISASIFPLRWIAQGYRSVFLPDSYAQQEVAGNWEHGRIALVLAAWAIGGLLLTLRTFRWRNGKDA
ncbi:MAG: ABC transporter [Actinobacteria bacterium 13_2_20CM_2_71_6]|nr:MAG: ABC transporter [Actinobacteria bacterium 13_2_20CM_2_71_6]